MLWLKQNRFALTAGFLLGAAFALGVGLAIGGFGKPPWLEAVAVVCQAAVAVGALGLTWFLASAADRAHRHRRARFLEDIGQLANMIEWRQSEAHLAVQAKDRPAFLRALTRLAESGLAADRFAELPIEAWPSPTLCAQWTLLRHSLLQTAGSGLKLLARWGRSEQAEAERQFLLAIKKNRTELGKFGEVWSLARGLK